MNLFSQTSDKRFAKQLGKAGNFEESKHQRDEKGRFTSGGGVAAGAAAAGLGLAGAAAAGLPGARALLPGLRRAVLGARHRIAREDARGILRATTATSGGSGPDSRLARAAMGAVGARGREQPHTNALRFARDQFSAAARRRRVRQAQQQMPSWW